MANQAESVPVESSASARARLSIVASIVALTIVALAIPPVHDGVVTCSENSVSEAYWKWLYWGNRGLPEAWHRVVPEGSGDLGPWARGVSRVGEDVYTVDGWVERLDERGVRERRGCTWWLWRESYDVWHKTRISIHGEAPIEMDDVDGPTGKEASLWCTRIERSMRQDDSVP